MFSDDKFIIDVPQYNKKIYSLNNILAGVSYFAVKKIGLYHCHKP